MNPGHEPDIDRRLQDIERRLYSLEQRLSYLRPPVVELLQQRGFVVDSYDPVSQVVLPEPPTPNRLERYYLLLHRYSFRILLRDVIRERTDFTVDDLRHYCSARKASRFLQELIDLGIVAPKDPKSFRLVNQAATSFGDTLEWYVAQILEREFASAAVWGVKLRGLQSGGDYDVIARVGPNLAYLEVKSSPPRNIEQPAISGFLRRLHDLQPNLAVFLEDTHLKMEIKINLMFESERGSPPATNWLGRETRMLRRGVFQAGARIFIINSKPSITHNLRVCLRTFWMQKSRL